MWRPAGQAPAAGPRAATGGGQLRLRTGSSAATGWALNAWQTPMLQAAPLCPAAYTRVGTAKGQVHYAVVEDVDRAVGGQRGRAPTTRPADWLHCPPMVAVLIQPASGTHGIAKWMLGLVAVAVPRSMIGGGT